MPKAICYAVEKNEPSIGSLVPNGKLALLNGLQQHIRMAHVRAGLPVNRGMALLYWNLGREILTRQEGEGWGAKTNGRLSRDLRAAFTEVKKFSPRTLKYTRAFAKA